MNFKATAGFALIGLGVLVISSDYHKAAEQEGELLRKGGDPRLAELVRERKQGAAVFNIVPMILLGSGGILIARAFSRKPGAKKTSDSRPAT